MNSSKTFIEVKNARYVLFLAFLVSIATAILLQAVPAFAATKSDLIPTKITYTPSELIVGQSIYFDSGIKNAGQTSTRAFNIKWFVNNVQVGYGSHSGISAQKTVMNGNSQLSYTFNSPGTYNQIYS